jgi:hypothetical protein
MIATLTPHVIEKENIPGLNFPESDVLKSDAEREKRKKDLLNANELGDLAQYKVKILFEDSFGPKKVETTVWRTTETDVILKYGIRIPIHRVNKVYFP